MKVCNLSSGSDGNATYIEGTHAKILVDAGLSCKELESRLALLKVAPEEIDAILITHEHTDHIKGLDVFVNRYRPLVFVHKDGLNALRKKLKKPLVISTFDDAPFLIEDLKILPIAVPHDVDRCTGYVISENEKKISIITDLGHTTNEILQNLFGSSLVFLEANHDVARLRENKNYPSYLKNRILGQNGHLSNDSCAEAIVELAKNGCRQVVLSHLSTENNTPELAYDYITKTLKKYGIIEGENIKIDVAGLVPKAIFRL